MKKAFLLLVGMIFMTSLLGCETIKGVGQDIKNTGENLVDLISGNGSQAK